MAEQPSTKSSGKPPLVRFHYIKSNLFRVIHVDGAIGSITPSGLIHCALYSERPAIPQVTEHELSGPEQPLGPASIVEGKAGFVREIDVDFIMTKEKAVELRQWLSDRIAEFDKIAAGSAKNAHPQAGKSRKTRKITK
jgi:hypothetical protein